MRPESTIILIRSNDSPNKLISEKKVSTPTLPYS